MTNHLAYLSLALYAASFCCYVRILYAPHNWLGRLATLLLAAGILLHYFALLERSRAMHAVPYDDLYGSMSLFAWLLAVTYLGLEVFHRQRSVGVFVTFLLILWLGALELRAPVEKPASPAAHGPLFALHVTLNTWAYAAFALSFVLSLIYLAENRILRSRRPGAAFWRFPALEALDVMARSSVYMGLAALTAGVVMGVIWARRLLGASIWDDPKVAVTLAIFIIYGAYLRLSRRANWRGARAALLCAANFSVVLFSYTFVNKYLTRFHHFL
jgi:ABC-type transport system involved in cytochrome c biogenesis permease subunit